MIEEADPEYLMQEGAEALLEVPAVPEERVEDAPYLTPDLSASARNTLPYVSWAILMLSVALLMAASNPSYAHHAGPITETLAYLAIMERYLQLVAKKKD
jgi:hypothetical protein